MECPNITVTMATEADLESIFRMRHEVYATELGQHAENDSRRLTDSLDDFNTYIVARVEGEVGGLHQRYTAWGSLILRGQIFLAE